VFFFLFSALSSESKKRKKCSIFINERLSAWIGKTGWIWKTI
jgi:hypothetical protein